MRYTRYDYKKKSGGNFFAWLLLVVILAIAIGIIIFKVFFNGGGFSNPLDFLNNDKEQEEKLPPGEEDEIFRIVQCGLYSKEENAKAILTTLPNGMKGFIVEEDGKFKVMAGIYKDEDGSKKVEELTKATINSFSIKCALSSSSIEGKMKVEIINALLQVINKIEEKDVKSVNTAELKKWTEESISNIEKSSEELDGLVKTIKELPEEFSKNNVEDSKKYLYNLLIKYRV